MTARPSGALGLSYTSVENLLVDLTGADRSSLVARFRKLRPRLAGDGLLTKGARVEYDLHRTLAIAAIYLINSAGVPQGHAVDIVLSNWPEVVRAAVAAAVEAGVLVRPIRMPKDFGSRLFISVDAFDPTKDPERGSISSWARDSLHPDSRISLVLDVLPILDAIVRLFDRRATSPHALTADMTALEVSFGWPRDTSDVVAPAARGRTILDDGPYFGRARTLLNAVEKDLERQLTHAKLQTFLDYIEGPAPIDEWKSHVGVGENEMRLGQLLSSWGGMLGLDSKVVTSATLRAASGDARARAFEFIEAAERAWPRS